MLGLAIKPVLRKPLSKMLSINNVLLVILNVLLAQLQLKLAPVALEDNIYITAIVCLLALQGLSKIQVQEHALKLF